MEKPVFVKLSLSGNPILINISHIVQAKKVNEGIEIVLTSGERLSVDTRFYDLVFGLAAGKHTISLPNTTDSNDPTK